MSSGTRYNVVRWLPFNEGDYHRNIDESQIPYKSIQSLGQGGYSIAEEVRDQNTGFVYARKVCMLRKDNKAKLIETFKNELAIIQSLARHRHIICLFAAYTTKNTLGLILTPVADNGDLEAFLDDFAAKGVDTTRDQRAIDDMAKVLHQSFGCLSDGLRFLKQSRIRHKDIKTRNIIVHQGRVLYTDFGLSFAYQAAENSMTDGPTAMTRKYAAPEVRQFLSRGSSSDVFSLGCVYLEILMALMGSKFIEHDQLFSDVLPKIHQRLLWTNVSPSLRFLPAVIIAMTHVRPSERWNPENICDHISKHPGFSCPECTASHDASAKVAREKFSMRDSYTTDLCTVGKDEGITNNEETAGTRFEVMCILGRGSSGTVSMIRDAETSEIYMRKVVTTSVRSSKQKTHYQMMQRELKLLRQLISVRHIIQLHTTIVSKTEIALVMQPVVNEGNLEDLLAHYIEVRTHSTDMARMNETLETAFGCLARALEWTHQKGICHGDIKPKKILIHSGSVVLSTSRASRDMLEPLAHKAEGHKPSDSHSKIYWAQETHHDHQRSPQSDVFFLGCVCLEIAAALIPDFTIVFERKYTDQMETLLQSLCISVSGEEKNRRYIHLYPLILSMTQETPLVRMSASMMGLMLKTRIGFMCNECQGGKD